MPEDIASDATGRMLYVTSVRHHSLYRVTLPSGNESRCRLDEVPLPASAKRWPTLAVSYDSMRNLLWMTSSAMPEFSGIPEGDNGKAALLAIDPHNGDPRNGSLVHRFDLAGTQPGVLGDMTVTSEGSVFVTDSMGGGVYRVQGDINTAHLEKIAE